MSSIPCDLTFIRAFVFDIDGVISRSITHLDEEGNPRRTVNVKDAYAIQYAIRKKYILAVITGGYSPKMEIRMTHLGMRDYYQQSRSKIRDLEDFMSRYQLKPEEIMYVGDDLPDLPVLRTVGIAVAPKDAVPEVQAVAHYISPYAGGEGVARDVIEQTLRAQGTWATGDLGLSW